MPESDSRSVGESVSELKITKIKIDFVPSRVQAIDKNAPGVSCSASNTMRSFVVVVVVVFNSC